MNIQQYIAAELPHIQGDLSNVITLLADGATVPFIARYRKEATGGMDEVDIADIKNAVKGYHDLISRKETVLASIAEQGKLTAELKDRIANCWQLIKLEDIYLPYKRKRKTRADKARDLGLEGLAKVLMAQREHDVVGAARRFVKGQVATADEALAGARDIIAEWISENERVRDVVRQAFEKYAVLTCKAKKVRDEKKKEEAKHYKDYWDYSSRLDRTPGHRLLAIRRGEREGLLSASIDIDAERVIQRIDRFYIKGRNQCAEQIEQAIDDSYKRLIKPSIETEFANKSKLKADKEAIEIFAKNLKQLLLEAPLGEVPVLAIDPGFRTGCKVAVIDAQGDLLTHTTIYPHPPQQKYTESAATLKGLLSKYDIQHVAVGNGTAGRETESHVKGLGISDLQVYLISEAGASIYSASEVARQEFPDLDLTVRGAVSIGRRLKDPLAELIKIDAKSIGVGQYQHDVDQGMLRQSLEDTVVSSVNAVGINLNTASSSLLTYVSGLGPTLAQRIVDHRTAIGQYTDRRELKAVKGLGAKAYQQAAGFLRVRDGVNPLDNSAVHPERYSLVTQMAKAMQVSVQELVGNAQLVKSIPLQTYVSDDVGIPTLQDIASELIKPGIDPRGQAETFAFHPYLQSIDDVKVGMRLPGIVVNVAKFGAFVDIGIKENGLVHVSQITNRFISDPNEVLSVNQKIEAKVIGVDLARKRIQLSLKE